MGIWLNQRITKIAVAPIIRWSEQTNRIHDDRGIKTILLKKAGAEKEEGKDKSEGNGNKNLVIDGLRTTRKIRVR